MLRAIVFKQQAIPLLQLVVVQVQLRVAVKMRRGDELPHGFACGLAAGVIRPVVQRANQVAQTTRSVGRDAAFALQNQSLAVAANVGNQLDTRFAMNQRSAGVFLRQGVKVARIGGCKAVADVARAILKQGLLFALEKRFVKIAVDG